MRSEMYYRMFEEKGGLPCTLFHGVDGSRQLPLNTWITAKVAIVKDGTGGKEYQSGFHVLPALGGVVAFLNHFTHLDSRVICAVEVSGLWPKIQSPAPVFLARKMRIPSDAWDKRVSCMEVQNDS